MAHTVAAGNLSLTSLLPPECSLVPAVLEPPLLPSLLTHPSNPKIRYNKINHQIQPRAIDLKILSHFTRLPLVAQIDH